jgi:hypothetical protein
VGAVDIASPVPATFEFDGGAQITLDQPHLKAALALLANHFPARVSFDEVVESIAAFQPQGARRAAEDLLFELYITSSLDVYARQIDFARSVSHRPTAAAVARAQARLGHQITNRLHGQVDVDPATRRLIELLDGSRDVRQLEEQLNTGGSKTDVLPALARLASAALLVS